MPLSIVANGLPRIYGIKMFRPTGRFDLLLSLALPCNGMFSGGGLIHARVPIHAHP